jgi:hypothetical protein
MTVFVEARDLEASYQTWLAAFQKRVAFFADACTVKGSNVVLMLPDLLCLFINLSRDERVPAPLRQEFGGTAHRLMRGIEYLPEDDLSMVALLSDVDKLAQLLEKHLPALSEVVCREHWRGEDDLAATVYYLLYKRERYAPEC